MTDTDRIAQIMGSVEASMGMGGLSSGIYGEFAREVARLVAEDCAKVCSNHGAIESYVSAGAIRARYSKE